MNTKEQYALDFTKWKDDNFLLNKDSLYYPFKTFSEYYDITLLISFKKQESYTLPELLELYTDVWLRKKR